MKPTPTNFFDHFQKDRLGATKLVRPSLTANLRGEPQKLLDLTVDDKFAVPLVISIRSEYSTQQATVSNTLSSPVAIVGATNAAPIVITTAVPHGFVTGQNATVTGVRGNLAANLVTTITVTGPTTFSLDGSDGTLAGAYLGPSGQVVVTSLGGTGTGIAQVGSPLVGSLLWGVGGGENQIDFDVPSPRFPDFFFPGPNQQPESNIGSGVQIAVNASHVSLYVRNDAWLGPLTNPLGGTNIGSVSPAKVIAFASPSGSTNTPPLQRTIFCAGSDAGAPADNLAAGATVVVVPVPPFAKSVRFARIPSGTPLTVAAANNVNVVFRQVDIPVNSEGPMLLDGFTHGLRITNTAAVPITYLQAIFDVTPL